ncbi:hypothetical protein [Bradyrhizobium zhanjiangense]|uniref:DUF222 domain-containing protein n=1 Tax=Bradyrhizobium zhanjiangense TaxID=1325107 RepID=A0ABY0D9A3_9BRAD|nr:hypothetical protein [Bradyrhizobium zhanjiangense]RXG86497.1 hypothetical protein EAS62_37275 [Bradyrhizobium zhanjiangense]
MTAMSPEALVDALQVQIAGLDSAIAGLDAETGSLAFEDASGVTGAAKRLAAHLDKLELAKSDRALKQRALEVARSRAADSDKQRIERARAVSPAEAMKGITRTKCPGTCSAGGCALAGGLPRCVHPAKGGLPAELMNDRVLRDFNEAALAELAHQAAEDRLG